MPSPSPTRSIVCEACKVFAHFCTNARKKHKARIFIIRTYFFFLGGGGGGGGKLEGLGGKLPPRTPQ